MASRIINLTIVYSAVYSGADQRKHQSSALLAFVRGIHRWPVNSPHKGPVTRKCFHLMTSSCGYRLEADYLDTTSLYSSHFDFNERPWRRLDIKTAFPRYGIPMLKTRLSWNSLIFNMEDPYTGKTTSLYWDGPLMPLDKVSSSELNVMIGYP